MTENLIFKKATILLLILTVGFSPTLTYAKNNKEKKEKKEKSERVEREHEDHDEREHPGRGRGRALGHRIAPGFIKNWGSDDDWFDDDDFLKDCSRHHRDDDRKRCDCDDHATTTPDTTSPIISNLHATPATTTAVISWTTNEYADSTVFWSTTPGVTIGSASSKGDNSKTKNHQITLDGLTASTTYYLIVRSRDESSNVATSTETSLTTTVPPPPPVPDTTPPVISNVAATTTSSTTASLNWNTDELATSKLYYSTSSEDITATSTSFIESLSLTLNHILSLLNLVPDTLYYFLVSSTDNAGNTATSTIGQFSTPEN